MITKFADMCIELGDPWGLITFMGTAIIGVFVASVTLALLATHAPSLLFAFFILLGLVFAGLYTIGLVKLFRAGKASKKAQNNTSEERATYGTGYGGGGGSEF